MPMDAAKIASFVVLPLLLLMVGPSNGSAAPIVSAETTSVSSGGEFSIDVGIADVTDLFAFQFDVAFDPSRLMVLSVEEGSFLSGGGVTFFSGGGIDNTNGTITATAGTLLGAVAGVDGTGPLATINFRALGPGFSAVSLSNILLLDSSLEEIGAESKDGAVHVPEPATCLLLLTASAGWLSRRRRDEKGPGRLGGHAT
jgi:adhesin HecA-like repeat protein